MDFKLHCDHTVRIHDREDFFRVMRKHPVRPEGGYECMRCYLERKAALADSFFGSGPMEYEVVPAIKES